MRRDTPLQRALSSPVGGVERAARLAALALGVGGRRPVTCAEGMPTVEGRAA